MTKRTECDGRSLGTIEDERTEGRESFGPLSRCRGCGKGRSR